MVGVTKIAAISAAFMASTALAQLVKDCGKDLGNCPENKPCCSQYGQCGVGAYCLGGCDPIFSNSIDSCMPAPVCRSGNHKFTDSKRLISNTEYLGDATKHDFVTQGEPAVSDGALYLTMPRDSVGSVVSTTSYMWYGKVSAKMKTSRGAGVVTAFILMSDIKDEIDYEWVGVDLKTSQTNYYFEGITDYGNSGNISTSSSTFSDWHTYEIDWTPDQITWSIDGKVGRTQKRSDTLDSKTKEYQFPQTPSRIQFSLWPGGLASNGKGTIDWAGGEIKWDGPEFEDGGPGYYYAMVESVDIECYDPPKGVSKSGSKSYVFKNLDGGEKSVEITDRSTILGSFRASGENPDAGKDSNKDKKTDSDNVETVPGLTGAGFGTADSQRGEEDNGSGVKPKSTTDGFSQGGDDSSSSEAGTVQGERVVRGSMLAVFIAIVALGYL